MIPSQIWRLQEGGLMQEFGTDAKSATIRADDDKFQETVSKYVNFFKSIQRANNRYYFKFLVCEALNIVALTVNFISADHFLGGKFKTYGVDVVNYYSVHYHVRKLLHTINPMCDVFPTKVSCDVSTVGAGSGSQTNNGLCILSQNIINEKIYLVLWFWFIFLFCVAGFRAVYTAVIAMVPSVRASTLASLTRSSHKYDRITAKLVQGLGPGDCFVLRQVGRNCNAYFFRALLEELSADVESKNLFKLEESDFADKFDE